MVLNLSDQDSTNQGGPHHHDDSGDHAPSSMPPSPEAAPRVPIMPAGMSRAILAQHLAAQALDAAERARRDAAGQQHNDERRRRDIDMEMNNRGRHGGNSDVGMNNRNHHRYEDERRRSFEDDGRPRYIANEESSPERRMDYGGEERHIHERERREEMRMREDEIRKEMRRNNEESPLDFSVRRQESAESYRSNDSNLDSAGEPVSPGNSPNNSRRSSTDGPLSPPGGGQLKYNRMVEDKIGEPKIGPPGMHPGMQFPVLPGQLPPGFPLNMMAHMNLLNNMPQRNMDHPTKNSGHHNTNANDNKSGTRPFKAYPKDPLSLPLGYFGLPGVAPLPGIDPNVAQAFSQVNSEETFRQYRDYIVKRIEQERQQQDNSNKSRTSPNKHNDSFVKSDEHPMSPIRGSPPLSPHERRPSLPMSPEMKPKLPPLSPLRAQLQHPPMGSPRGGGGVIPPPLLPPSVITQNPSLNNHQDMKPPVSPEQLGSLTPNSLTPTTALNSTSSFQSRKRGRSNSDGSVLKDGAYWERRRKNNEAAKRSRDSRRAKEDEIAIRAAFLEQENLKLRVEVAALKNETAKLRCMIYNS